MTLPRADCRRRCRSPFAVAAVAAFALALAAAGSALAQTPVLDPLEQARRAYNEARYDEAIRLASEARQTPARSGPAALIVARAHLEQFRKTYVREDLVAAREALRLIDASSLNAREGVELLIAFGLSLYLDDEHSLDDRFSAAAEQFEVALGRAEGLDAASRDLLFDWWAGSLDRQAQQGPETERVALYERLLTRAETELRANPTAISASYWMAAAARGADDLPRAVGAAMAGWIRAGSLGERGLTLRQDLDRLMMQVILPERARELVADVDPRPTLSLLEAQWAQVKQKWTR